ncbi:MAG: nucleotidyl transferase AbiEii/AbiGii toxin family protein [Candidatus Omnitrophica bacterium]|nr:nucleotidyl transferase AbiEii/AbiGii toxin family protein [Candidatus Omnitrophota bacterium]
MLELDRIESFFPEPLRRFKRNMLREYLQYKILETVFSSSYGRGLVFMGGTAIHVAHGLPRFSEDLDFDNRGLGEEDFRKLAAGVSGRLFLEGYAVETGTSFKGTFSADIKIAGILFKEGLSGHREEKILIKLDAEPQGYDYTPERVVINKFDVFAGISVVPAPVLLAQKYFAILARKRAMGRDFYDAIFLAGKTGPDYGYLKTRAGIPDKAALKEALLKRCSGLDLAILAGDVEPFVFTPGDAKKIALFTEHVKGW